MSAAPEPFEAATAFESPEISEAAQQARERLHREIERVRNGVEEMLDEQDARSNAAAAVGNPEVPAAGEDLRRELEELRIETRDYVKKKIRKSEKQLERSVREIDARTDALERRIDQVEADREEAEWRIHNDTEAILDGLLEDVREIADQLEAPPAAPASPPGPRAPQGPAGRPGPRPLGARR